MAKDDANLWAEGLSRLAAGELAVMEHGAVSGANCDAWAEGVLAARDAWTADFGGAQHSLGRAFYTHLETDRSAEYFASAAASDALVERHAPGLQEAMRALLASAVGGRVLARPGWCSAGVHVFPAGGEVARAGGVVHFDTEGLARDHIAQKRPAVSLVLVLRPPERGGGLRLWSALYRGRDEATREERRSKSITVEARAGDAVLFDSYRLHQIQPFPGPEPRISATLHGALIDAGLWESWF